MQGTSGPYLTETAYRLNAQDEIIWVSQTWDGFAVANDGGGCLGNGIKGSSLWSHITGDATRMWLKSLASVVRNCGKVRDVAYRCDSPRERRFMRMRIIPETGGNLLVEHAILGRVARARPVYPVYKPGSALLRCSSCGRGLHEGVWVESDQPEIIALTSHRGLLPVVYGICDGCKAALPGTCWEHPGP
jgi:hypothetical protein